MPMWEIRCADEGCPYHQPGAGFIEDGSGQSPKLMSAHRKETGHAVEGLYEDGAMVIEGRNIRQATLWLRNHGAIRTVRGPEAEEDDEADEGDDGDAGADGFQGPVDDWGQALPLTPGDEPIPATQAARNGRPPLPDLTRGYVVARDIPIDPLITILFEVHFAAFEDLYLDDAGEVLPFGRAIARWLASCVRYDQSKRPSRYPLKDALDVAHFEDLNNERKMLDAREAELRAYKAALDKRNRDIMERESALAPAGGAADGGA